MRADAFARCATRGVSLLLICCCLFTPHAAQAQDSLATYRKLQDFADKRRFTRWLHDAIFVRVPDEATAAPAPDRPQRDPHRAYRGRVIRQVRVHVLDPFGSSASDTTTRDLSGIERLGNGLHRRTREHIIRDLLLFKDGDHLDPLELAETERILRSYPLVNDATVRVVPVSGSDAVDVRVIVQDRWSIEGTGSGDATSLQLRGTENNLLGFGQLLQQEVAYDRNRASPVWSGQHRVYTIGESYISTRASYRASQELDQVSLAFDRPFFSPLARWAGSINGGRTWYTPSLDPVREFERSGTVETTSLDAWGGMSLRSAKDTSDAARSTRYVVAARYYQTDHRVPSLIADTTPYINTRTALASFQVSVRQYATERYLYRFGSTEDVAEGLLLSATTGVHRDQTVGVLPYTSLSGTRAKYMESGTYLLVTLGAGTLWRQGRIHDARTVVSASGFSPLIRSGRWRLRQFVQGAFAKVIHPSSIGMLNLGGDQLIRMDPYPWYGDQKLFLRSETVVYAPYSLIGFRFAPVLLLAMGTLGWEHQSLDRTFWRSAVGLGLMIRNERLLSGSLRISFAFYPGLPSDLGDPSRYNAMGTLTMRSPDLAPSAPAMLGSP